MAEWFKLRTTVEDSACGADGFMRPDAWFMLFQWAAGVHSRAMGCDHDGILPESIVWILLGAHTKWSMSVRAGDHLVISTAPAASAHGMFQRRVNVETDGGGLIVENVGYWALLDKSTRRMTRCDAISDCHIKNEIGQAARPVMFAPLDGASASDLSYTPGAADIDENGHVNNTRYVTWLSDALRHAGSPGALRTLDVWYAAEVMPGEALTGKVCLADEGRFTFEVFRLGNVKACFTAAGTVGL